MLFEVLKIVTWVMMTWLISSDIDYYPIFSPFPLPLYQTPSQNDSFWLREPENYSIINRHGQTDRQTPSCSQSPHSTFVSSTKGLHFYQFKIITFVVIKINTHNIFLTNLTMTSKLFFLSSYRPAIIIISWVPDGWFLQTCWLWPRINLCVVSRRRHRMTL